MCHIVGLRRMTNAASFIVISSSLLRYLERSILPMFACGILFPNPDIAKLMNSSPVIVVREVFSAVQIGNETFSMLMESRNDAG